VGLDQFLISSENREKSTKVVGDSMVLRSIEKNFKGKIITLPSVCSHSGKAKVEGKSEIKLIRAAYGRSIAVLKDGHVYCWGQGFRNEHIAQPVLIFEDPNGIFDL
jgi:hypothetical protein